MADIRVGDLIRAESNLGATWVVGDLFMVEAHPPIGFFCRRRSEPTIEINPDALEGFETSGYVFEHDRWTVVARFEE